MKMSRHHVFALYIFPLISATKTTKCLSKQFSKCLITDIEMILNPFFDLWIGNCWKKAKNKKLWCRDIFNIDFCLENCKFSGLSLPKDCFILRTWPWTLLVCFKWEKYEFQKIAEKLWCRDSCTSHTRMPPMSFQCFQCCHDWILIHFCILYFFT